jgi:hypothetical protein
MLDIGRVPHLLWMHPRSKSGGKESGDGTSTVGSDVKKVTKPKRVDALGGLLSDAKHCLVLYSSVTSLAYTIESSMDQKVPKWEWAITDPDGHRFKELVKSLGEKVAATKHVDQVLGYTM